MAKAVKTSYADKSAEFRKAFDFTFNDVMNMNALPKSVFLFLLFTL